MSDIRFDFWACQRPLFEGIQKKMMFELLKKEPQTGTELAERVSCTPSAISKALVKLVEGEPIPYVLTQSLQHSRNVKLIRINPDFRKSLKH